MAQAGVTTALLAEMGCHGDLTLLEGEHGFWAMNGAPGCDWEKITSGLGQEWVFMNAAYKYWPTCGMFQSPLDAFTRIIDENDIRADEIEQVTVKIEALGSLPKYVNVDPHDHVEAASSLPYCIAVAAHRIPRGPHWQSRTVLADPRIRGFMPKVRHETHPRSEELRQKDLVTDGLPYLRHRPADVEVRARGRVFAVAVDFANWLSIGVDACRASDEGLAQKFRANAESVLAPQKTRAAIDAIMNLETLAEVSTLTEALAA
jgi:2-methylcitrate dehydratase PrpD